MSLVSIVRPDFDVERHFTPSYGPWDQRVCLVTNGDLFTAMREGTASVVTDHIDTFTERFRREFNVNTVLHTKMAAF